MDTEGTGRGFLRAAEGPAQGEKFPIRDRMVFGRASDCDACLNDPTLSRQHFRLRLRGAEVEVEDLGSTNGVKVNGRFVSNAPLNPGDRIEAGDTVLVYESAKARRRPGRKYLLFAAAAVVVVAVAFLVFSPKPGRGKQTEQAKARAAEAESQGRNAEAVSAYQQLMQLEPKNPQWPKKVDEMSQKVRLAEECSKAVRAAQQMRDYVGASAILDALESKYPGNSDVVAARAKVQAEQVVDGMMSRAGTLQQQGKFDQAVGLLDSAGQASADTRFGARAAGILVAKGQSLERRGDKAGARTAYEEAQKRDPKSEDATRALGDLAAGTGSGRTEHTEPEPPPPQFPPPAHKPEPKPEKPVAPSPAPPPVIDAATRAVAESLWRVGYKAWRDGNSKEDTALAVDCFRRVVAMIPDASDSLRRKAENGLRHVEVTASTPPVVKTEQPREKPVPEKPKPAPEKPKPAPEKPKPKEPAMEQPPASGSEGGAQQIYNEGVSAIEQRHDTSTAVVRFFEVRELVKDHENALYRKATEWLKKLGAL